MRYELDWWRNKSMNHVFLCLGSSMWSILFVQIVWVCVLGFLRCICTSHPKVLLVQQWLRVLGSRRLDYNVWSERCLEYDSMGIAVSCPGLLGVSSGLLAVGFLASLWCWLTTSWCLLWRMWCRWCLCFPWDVFLLFQFLYAGKLSWDHIMASSISFLTKGDFALRQYVILGASFSQMGYLWGTFGRYWLMDSHLRLFNMFTIFGAQ